MTFKSKALIVGLVTAALGVTMPVLAPAQVGGHITSTVVHISVTTESVAANPPTFTAFGQTIGCSETTGHGTLFGNSPTWYEITYSYTTNGCEVKSLGFPAHVNMNGCHLVFTVAVNPSAGDSTTHIVCPSSEGPVITATTGGSEDCTLTITPNITPGGGVSYTTANEAGKPAHTTLDMTISGMHVLRTTGGFFSCGTFSSTDANGGFGGEMTGKGFDTSGNQVSFTAT